MDSLSSGLFDKLRNLKIYVTVDWDEFRIVNRSSEKKIKGGRTQSISTRSSLWISHIMV